MNVPCLNTSEKEKGTKSLDKLPCSGSLFLSKTNTASFLFTVGNYNPQTKKSGAWPGLSSGWLWLPAAEDWHLCFGLSLWRCLRRYLHPMLKSLRLVHQIFHTSKLRTSLHYFIYFIRLPMLHRRPRRLQGLEKAAQSWYLHQHLHCSRCLQMSKCSADKRTRVMFCLS